MDFEEVNSQVDVIVGLEMPMPPSPGGKLRRPLSRSLEGDLPVREGTKFVQMQFSSG